MKEHVLYHLETDPPKRIYQRALVRYTDSANGGWVVVRYLGDQAGPSQADGSGSDIEKFRITGQYHDPTSE
jgi:hypothetical protein